MRKVLYAREEGVDWRQLVASQLHEIGRTAAPRVSDSRSYDMECLRQVGGLSRQHRRAGDGMACPDPSSRATFFRLKRMLGGRAAGGTSRRLWATG